MISSNSLLHKQMKTVEPEQSRRSYSEQIILLENIKFKTYDPSISNWQSVKQQIMTDGKTKSPDWRATMFQRVHYKFSVVMVVSKK